MRQVVTSADLRSYFTGRGLPKAPNTKQPPGPSPLEKFKPPPSEEEKKRKQREEVEKDFPKKKRPGIRLTL